MEKIKSSAVIVKSTIDKIGGSIYNGNIIRLEAALSDGNIKKAFKEVAKRLPKSKVENNRNPLVTHAEYVLKRYFNKEFLKEQTWTSLVSNRPSIEDWMTFPFKGRRTTKEASTEMDLGHIFASSIMQRIQKDCVLRGECSRLLLVSSMLILTRHLEQSL